MASINRDPISLLKEFQIPYLDQGKQFVTVKCPFHADHEELEKAHGGVNRDNGAFKCFSCNATKTVVAMIAATMGVAPTVVDAHVDDIFGTKNKGPVSADLIEFCHRKLLDDKEYQQKLLTRHGIDINAIAKYRLGLYSGTNRITIPVKGINGDYVNLRQYKYDTDHDKIIGMKYGGINLFLRENVLANETIYITEGEFKAIILSERGFPACSSTGGAGNWKPEWNELFRDKHCIVVYDVDDKGRKGASKLCIALFRWAKSIKNIYLTAVADNTTGSVKEYFVQKKLTPDDFQKLVDSTAPFQPPSTPSLVEDDSEIEDVSLSKTGLAKYNGKLVRTNAVVSAKDTAPYIVPKKCTVVCQKDRDYCQLCHVFMKAEAHTFEIPASSAQLLEMINTTEDGQNDVLRRFSKIYPQCKAASFRRDESYNVEEIRVVPQIAIGSTVDEQVTRKVYHIGHGIACNSNYEFEARVCSEPKDGHATMVAFKSAPLKDDIDNFTPSLDLSIFNPIDWTKEACKVKLDDIYEDLENNVTRVYQRVDLHLFIDLVYHSALFFRFDGKQIKGWADALIIGDSGQGKSETSTRLQEHYKCGERVDTKKASVAGLVGGLQETSKRWFVSWGTIPLNDRRLVILEEIKGMGVAELSKMTDMRSRGEAEIVKIERAKTWARTRLLWISNPRSDSNMSAYNYGVQAVKELIGTLEDIRRFDMVIAVCRGEVPQSIMNAKHRSFCPHNYKSDYCSQLVSWAWSRTAEQIIFEADAEQEVFDAATRMGERYSSSCPIVEPSDQRLKLARLSVAMAARLFSTDDEEQNVIVRKCHVELVEDFLNRIYSSKALGYYDYSQSQKGESRIDDKAIKEAEAIVKAWPNARDCVRGLLEADLVTEQDIANFTEWPLDRCNSVIGSLTRLNCLKRHRRGGYRKTAAFIEILKTLETQTLPQRTYREIATEENI